MSLNNGWISLHRKLLDWQWYCDHNTTRLFVHCLLKANHKPAKWRGIDIDSGQFISSRDHLSSETGLSVQQVRTSLNKLKSTSEITIKTTNKYSIISITNWNSYQDNNQQERTQTTNKQPTSNQQVTTNNNDNNKNNDNNRFEPPSLFEVQQYISEKQFNIDADQFIDYYQSKGWMIGKNKMKDWKAACRTWGRRSEAHNGKSKAKRFSDKLDEIAARDIEENGFTDSLG